MIRTGFVAALDLKAVEEDLTTAASDFGSARVAKVGLALLAALRATRKALQDYVSYANSINVPHGCSCERCYRARIVLTQVSDGEAAP